MCSRYVLGSVFAAILWIPLVATAGEAVIEDAVAEVSNAGGYNFSVTVRHADTGWSHFADKWVVLAPDGETVLGERVLFHPHVNEQPFTRGLRSVMVPVEYKEVLIQVHDREHGWSNQKYTVKLPDR